MSLIDGIRIINKSHKRKKSGWKKYSGNPKQICEQIINECYNTEDGYFQTSTGHFNQFYVRDFSFVAKSLNKLGQKEKVRKTLIYANKCFNKKGRITSQIQPNNKPVESYGMAVDTLPLYVHTFIISNNQDLLDKELIKKELKNFEKLISKDNFVKKNNYLGWMRDHYKTKSSCYANCMLLMLKNDLDKLKIKHNIKLTNEQFMKEFWNGQYFYYDRRKQQRIEGSANVYPFWCKIINDKTIYKKAMNAIKKAGLDKPLPLKYESTRDDSEVIFPLQYIVPNYEGNSVWIHLGICYMEICEKSDLKKYVNSYKKLIEENKNFLEVLTPEGKPLKTRFYCTDEGMLWAAGWLAKVL